MNILFLFLRHSENEKDSTLTKDLSDEFHRQGHNVMVVTILERKYKRKTEFKIENGYRVLRVKTGNYFDSVGKFEKGITVFTMINKLKKDIIKYIGGEKIDLIYTHTPFISSPSLVKVLKEEFSCSAMLNYWDIFPQNAIDLRLLKNKFIIKYFKKKEEELYKIYDYIGCMSTGNIDYIVQNREGIDRKKLFLLKNWAKLKPKIEINRKEVRKKYKLNNDDYVAVFGGNMGRPQKLENIVLLAEKLKMKKEIVFLFIGKGTEKKKIENIVKEKKLDNIKMLDYVPREDYEKIIGACDVGIVTLDERFTIPNYPSKTTDYFKLSIPIFASLDDCSKNDYGVMLEGVAKAGLVAKAGEIIDMKKKFLYLFNDEETRKTMGNNGRKYYEENLGVKKAYEIVMKKIGEKNV